MMVQDPNSKKSANNADEAQVEALFAKARQVTLLLADESRLPQTLWEPTSLSIKYDASAVLSPPS
jgi:hypothetical protein